MLTHEEVAQVENWRFRNRMPSRSAAVRALMNIGMQAGAAVDVSALSDGSTRSSEVSVVGNASLLSLDGPARHASNRPEILVAEGNFLVGQGIRAVLERADFRVAGPLKGPDEAIPLLAGSAPHAAVIGFRPGDWVLVALADRLADLGCPFLFCTDADPRISLPERFRSAPVVSQTSAEESLVHAVEDLIRTRG